MSIYGLRIMCRRRKHEGDLSMAKYEYKNRIIELPDELVEVYKSIWFGNEPDETVFASFLSIEFGAGFDINKYNNQELSAAIAKHMQSENESNR